MNIDNLNTLIAHLEAQPAERFSMKHVFTTSKGGMSFPVLDLNICGTAACIAGHCAVAKGVRIGIDWDSDNAAEWLGISPRHEQRLFMPDEYGTRPERYTLPRAIATLKRLRDTYLATGQVVVDWGPEPGQGQPWFTPHVSEIIAPSLPAEITGLLRNAQTVEA